MQLVYLDTSFLSQLSQFKSGNLKVSAYNELWGELLIYLRKCIQHELLLCPASQFQIQEALLAPNLIDGFIDLQTELSRGLFFKHWEDILIHQAANQLLIYIKRPENINLGWKVLCREIPPVIPPNETILSKWEMEQFAKMKQQENVSARPFGEQYVLERSNLLRETFLLPICQIKAIPTLSKPSASINEILSDSYLLKSMNEANIPLDKTKDCLDFFDTNLVDEIPFVRIFCSLFASIRLSRKYHEGDWLDVAAMSCAIPYCSIMTTDKAVKHRIVHSLKLFDRRYIVDIYTASPDDIRRLVHKLHNLLVRMEKLP